MVYIFEDDDNSKYLASKYGYQPWMISRLSKIVPDLEDMLNDIETNNRKYIRMNTLKIEIDELLNRMERKGFGLKKTNIEEVYQVSEAKFPLGATTEYLMGYYYIQDLSSCLTVNELGIIEGETVLDMACAPGGKTSYISQKMNNSGLIIALDPSKNRLKSTFFNLFRCGVSNACLYRMDGRIANQLGIKFDKVLLDVPCSCEGIVSKDKSIKTKHSPDLIKRCSTRQLELLTSAIKVTKPGGLIIYSTCTFAPEENEYVINAVLDKDEISLENVTFGSEGLTFFGKDKLDKNLTKTKRLYPHIDRTFGFFIGKIRVR